MIIFLDIDGVLATGKSYAEHPFYQWDPPAVNAFYRLYGSLQANGVVISSDWRYMRKPSWFESAFSHYGAKDVVLLGYTEMDELVDVQDLGLVRGAKILKWMKDHKYTGDYVVLEDNLPIVQKHIPKSNLLWVDHGFFANGLTDLLVDSFLSVRS